MNILFRLDYTNLWVKMIPFMSKKMIIAWIIILPLIFSLGIFSGHYKTFPFDILSETKSMLFTDDNSTDDLQIFENDINSLIDITNESEIFQLKIARNYEIQVEDESTKDDSAFNLIFPIFGISTILLFIYKNRKNKKLWIKKNNFFN